MRKWSCLSLPFLDSQEKYLKIKVEQGVTVLQIVIWSPGRSSHLQKMTQLIGTEPEPSSAGFSFLALLCLQHLPGKSGSCLHLSFIGPNLCSTYYESGCVQQFLDREMKGGQSCLALFSELCTLGVPSFYTLYPSSLGPSVNGSWRALQLQAPAGPGRPLGSAPPTASGSRRCH